MAEENISPMFSLSPDMGIGVIGAANTGSQLNYSLPIMSTGHPFQYNPVQSQQSILQHPMMQPVLQAPIRPPIHRLPVHMPPPWHQAPFNLQQSDTRTGAGRPNSWPSSHQPYPSVPTQNSQQQPDHQYQGLEEMIKQLELGLNGRVFGAKG